VQDFQALTHWCSQDLDRTKAVQRALKILRVPKGWQTATAHAKTAVAEDNHPRMFTSGGGLALVYRCRQGKVDLSIVLGSHGILCCTHMLGTCTCTCACTCTWDIAQNELMTQPALHIYSIIQKL